MLRCLRLLAWVGAWAGHCLALMGGAAQASTLLTAQAWPLEVSAMPATAMTQTRDCMPCARCYVAPAPVALGVIAQPGHTNEPGWRAHDLVQLATTPGIHPRGWPLRLPVRILYCRWLD